MDSLIDTFHIDWRLIIAQMVNFGIVIIVLYKFAIKPLGKLMEERSAKIAGGLTDAKKHKELLGETEAEYKKVIAEARKESQELIAVAKKDAESVREDLIAKAKTDAEKVVTQGKAELEAEKEGRDDDDVFGIPVKLFVALGGIRYDCDIESDEPEPWEVLQ